MMAEKQVSDCLALPLPNCVTLDKLLNLPRPQFLHL